MKCENCYHYEACLNSLSENKGLNNTCREEAERALKWLNTLMLNC